MWITAYNHKNGGRFVSQQNYNLLSFLFYALRYGYRSFHFSINFVKADQFKR